jgi:hypothetical protein
MQDSIFFMLQASQNSYAPSMQWGGSPVGGPPPTWPPPPPTRFWPQLVQGYWRLPLQPYPGQPGDPPPPQMGQGYWPLPPWGSPPRGQALPPFGSSPLRTSPLRLTTSMPPTICLLDYFAFLRCPFCIPNTSIYMSFMAAQDHNKAADRDMTLSTASSTRWEDPTATTWCHNSLFAFACRSFGFGFTCHEL